MLLVLGVLVAVSLLGGSIALRIQRRAFDDLYDQIGRQVSSVSLQSVKHDMLESDLTGVKESLIALVDDELILSASIVSRTGVVWASDRFETIGTKIRIGHTLETISTTTTLLAIEERDAGSVLHVSQPIFNETSCEGCHDSSIRVLGAIDVEIDRALVDEAGRTQTISMLVIVAVAVALLGLAIYFIFRTTIVRPFSTLIGELQSKGEEKDRLLAADRLASLGEMTAGIAHEVNNPLAAILLYSELANQAALPPAVKRDLRVIRAEAKRASNIMKDLLTYSRKTRPVTRRIDVHKTLRKVLDMRQYQEHVRNIDIRVKLTDGPLQVRGNAAQLTQVFMNIIVNAEEAVESSDDKRIIVSTETDGEWTRISIADSGGGVSEEHLAQLFVPFFSTKPTGKGTGLGLAICHGIATAHGGLIRAENNDIGGATFVVELPLAKSRQ